MSGRYRLVDGEPVMEPDLLTWARDFETCDRQLLRDELTSDRLPEPVCISTVFLGLDHSYGSGPPVLWETMVFGGQLDQEQERYTSREAALAGHAAMIDRVWASL